MTRKLILSIAAAFLASCSGGGAGTVPATTTTMPAKTTAKATVTVKVPQKSASSTQHQPLYISPSTQSMVVTVTQTGLPP
ncbi:MAG: hypothetical protein JOZ38_11145, partial [Candidatus Eremiobacteraeota bacterium]|nr:hypothetical protein [Candidatus Eremiobacteraeota bacterium]